ncbi:hypothetical protein CARUB_v10016152mg [Capsella rubella]|uniref:F-box domain-containing protein n=1 Tax=Capsella rubella TaxID=81985 RepID=R0HSP7_9BRAS|nr:putative F-box only protein 9 [Capsella rubella]EOA32839.1 hypothetical protein CARUB_v10016152mg [Capsella rubella]
MMISNLPVDLVEEILSRIPTTSLKRLRLTCKQWNALFQTRKFTEKHLCKAPKEFMVLLRTNGKVCPMNVNLNIAAPSIEVKSALSLKNSDYNSEEVYINTVFHCDGLLLCTVDDDRLMVWNPCLGETRWIQLKAHDNVKDSTFALGYQNNRSYKILRCWKRGEPFRDFVFEIYELSSDSWKDSNKVSLEHFTPVNIGVSLKGNSYWVTIYKNNVYERNHLVRFDFTTKKFKRLCVPLVQNLDWIVLSIVREEQLTVLHRKNHTSKMDIWMADNIDDTRATLSWRKLFTVELKIPTNSVSYWICQYQSFFIDEEKKVVVYCDANIDGNFTVNIVGEDNAYYTEHSIVLSERWMGSSGIFSYVPSLVRIL